MGSVSMGNKNGAPVLREEDVEALCQTSGLSQDQVKEAYGHFVKTHPDGKIKMKEFSKMMAMALPQMEKHVFRIFDTNNDGRIDFVEFMLAYHIMANGTPEEALEKMFRVFDVDGDGTISLEEMKRLVKDMYGLVRGVGAVTQENLDKRMFKEMDADGDWKITVKEFVSACLSREELTRMLALKIIDIFEK